MQTLLFSNKDSMPILGLGTWKSKPGEVYEAVKEAIRIGYRHIDCAYIYGNETEVGRALSDSMQSGTVKREDLWITSKLWNDSHRPEHVAGALRKTLSDLKLDYLDLYLMHWPVALTHGTTMPRSGDDFLSLDEVSLTDTWRAMEDCADRGLTKHIGVSNFNKDQLTDLLDNARIPPAMNQVELHPYLQQIDLVQFCMNRGVHLTAYSPLGSKDRPGMMKDENEPVLLEDLTIAEIADKYKASPAQVLIAWAIQRGTAVIPKSVHPGRIAENLAAAELKLADEDMKKIATLDRRRRYVDGAIWAMEGSPYTLESLWGVAQKTG